MISVTHLGKFDAYLDINDLLKQQVELLITVLMYSIVLRLIT